MFHNFLIRVENVECSNNKTKKWSSAAHPPQSNLLRHRNRNNINTAAKPQTATRALARVAYAPPLGGSATVIGGDWAASGPGGSM